MAKQDLDRQERMKLYKHKNGLCNASGHKIKELRETAGLSQEQLAEKIGVSRQAISKWEGGLSTPELDKLKALSECFQISIDELTGNQTAGDTGVGIKENRDPICVRGTMALRRRIGP